MKEDFESKVISKLSSIQTTIKTIDERTEDQEDRIRGLERTKYIAIGIALAVSSISSVALGFILK